MEIADEEKPDVIAVDATGIGGAVADFIRHKGYNAIDIVSNSKAFRQDKFINKRVEMWFKFRELLRTNQLDIPNDDVLVGQLTSPKYQFDAQGRYVLEKKEDMKKRGLSSPDRGDAVILACAVDHEYASFVIKDEWERHAKPGTLEYIMAGVLQRAKEEEEKSWLIS
jgi:hypothetical protein